MGDAGQPRCVFRDVLHVDYAGDVAAATADKYTDARLVLGRDRDLWRVLGRGHQGASRLANRRQDPGCRSARLDHAVRNVLGLGERATDKHAGPGGLDGVQGADLAEAIAIEVDANGFGQRFGFGRFLHAGAEHHQVEYLLPEPALFGDIIDHDLAGARILFESRNPAAVVVNAQLLPPLKVGIKAFAEGPHIDLEDVDLDARHMVQGEHRLFGGVHAADGGAIVVVFVPGTDALQEGDAPWLGVVGESRHMALRRPGRAQQALKLHGGHDIGVTAVAQFASALGVVQLVAGGQDDGAHAQRLFVGRLLVIDGMCFAGQHTLVALGAKAAAEATRRLRQRLVLA